MFKTYKSLPDNYEFTAKIDMKDNKKEFILINLLSVIFFILTLSILSIVIRKISLDSTNLFITIIGCLIYIILHELVHAIFFKVKNDVKVKFKFHGFAASASSPGNYFQKKHYLIISLAPFILFSFILILILLLVNNNWFIIIGLIFSFHISGCSGDLYVFFRVLFMSKDVLVEDYGVGMNFFNKNNKENGD